MNQSDDLLAAVVANPDDDGPRLVLADWYDEHGEPERAEFIRVQISIASKDEFDPSYRSLIRREKELLRDRGHLWKIPELKGRQEFRRGFVEFVWMRGDRLLAEAKRIELVPTVRRLRVSAVDRRMKDLAELPWFSRICEIDLSNNSMVRFTLPDLFEEVDCSGIKTLVLRNVRLWAEELETLLGHPGFPSLARFDVSGNPFGDDGIAVLAASSRLESLRELIFRSDGQDVGDSVHAVGMASLAASKSLLRLQTLDLFGHNPGSNGLVSLFGSPVLTNVQTLCLAAKGYEERDGEWTTALTHSEHVKRMRILKLSGYFQRENDCIRLSRWEKLAGGCFLDIQRMSINSDEFFHLKMSPYVDRIVFPS